MISAAMDSPLLKEPPVVRGYPLVGVIPHLNADALAFISRLRDEHGDVVRTQIGNRTAIMISDPAMVEHILVTNPRNYSKKTRGYNVLRKLMGNGLLTSEGSFWLRQRRIAQPAFHRDRIAGFASLMEHDTIEMLDTWRSGVEFDVAKEMMKLTMRIVGETLLSSDVTKESVEIGDALTELLHQSMRRTRALVQFPDIVPTPMNVRFLRAKRVLDNAINRIIDERRKGVDKPDLLSMLMHIVDDETGEKMSDAQLRDEVMTLFVAGHETTANVLSWTLWLLSQHPQEEARLRAELAQLAQPPGAGDGTPAPLRPAHPHSFGAKTDAIMRAPFLDAVVKEAMRLFPPAWVLARFVEADEVVGGYPLRAGNFVFVSQYVVHRHPKWWKEPDRFVPQRFIDDPEPKQRYAYFPFSGGPRKCIGDVFAQMEMKIILVEIMKRMKLTVAPGARVVPEPVITLRPRNGLPMIASPA